MLKAHCNKCKKNYQVNMNEYCPFCDSTDVSIDEERKNKTKYNIEDFRGEHAEKKFWTALLNELHNIYTTLWELKEKTKN